MSIIREIWILAWPVMTVAAFHTIFNMVDVFWIGRLGTPQTAGVGLAASVYGVIMVLSALVSSGTLAIASRSVGSKDDEEFKDVAKQSIAYGLIFGIAAFLLAYIVKTPLLRIFGVSAGVKTYTTDYLNVIYFTIPINFLLAVLTSIMHSKGNTKTPMMVMIIANIINIIMDPILIFGINGYFAFGIKGAAAATLLGQMFAVLTLFILVLRELKVSPKEYFRDITLKYNVLQRIFRVGIFAVLYGITRPFTGLLMYSVAARSGDEAIAAFKVGGLMLSLLFILIGGLESAIAILVGQNLGKQDFDKIDQLIKKGIRIAFVCIMVLAIPYGIFPRQLMWIFTKDTKVIAIGARYLRIVYAGLVSVAFTTVCNAAFRGAGHNFPPMIAAFVANWLIKIPLAYLLSWFGWGSDGVWIAISFSVLTEAVIVWFFFSKGTWKSRKV